MNATQQLAAFVSEAVYDDLAEEVVVQAKRIIRDSIGCLIGGAATGAGQEFRHLLMAMAGPGPSTVAGEAHRVAPTLASHINAHLTNLLDFDDTMESGNVGHPGATIIPVALALAEETGATGQEVIAAVVAAYEVYARIAQAGKPTVERSQQLRGMATWQLFGAVAVAARLLRLDTEATARAFGLAALHAPVPFVGKIYEERPMWALKNNFGWAARGGVMGARFAAAGFAGNHSILEGETGFWAMAGSDSWDEAILTEDIGSYDAILDTSFKPYPCCRFTHSALDGVAYLVQTYHFSPDEIERVRIRSAAKVRVFADYAPQSYLDAQFSLPYVVSMMLLQEPPGLGWLTGERWYDADVLSLLERVVLEVDPRAEREFATGQMRVRVEITSQHGRVEQVENAHAQGHPKNPLSDRALQQKFMELTSRALGPEAAGRLGDSLDRLEMLPDLSEVTAMLSRADKLSD